MQNNGRARKKENVCCISFGNFETVFRCCLKKSSWHQSILIASGDASALSEEKKITWKLCTTSIGKFSSQLTAGKKLHRIDLFTGTWKPIKIDIDGTESEKKELEINDILIRIAVQPPNRVSNRGHTKTRRRPLHTTSLFQPDRERRINFPYPLHQPQPKSRCDFFVFVFALLVYFARNRPQI